MRKFYLSLPVISNSEKREKKLLLIDFHIFSTIKSFDFFVFLFKLSKVLILSRSKMNNLIILSKEQE